MKKNKNKAIKQRKINPDVNTVISLLGTGALLTASILFPGAPLIAKTAMDEYSRYRRKKESAQWERFNLWRLRAVLKRLQQQKMVKIIENDDLSIVKLTDKGKTYYLKDQLEQMIENKPPKWDGYWRLIIYDIGKIRKCNQEIFRYALKRLKCLRLQDSVYLYPYPCFKEIEYLRQYYGIGEEVQVLTVLGIENEAAYKKYFQI